MGDDVSLNSFLDRLGLEDEGVRSCVSAAFTPKSGEVLPGGETTACLGWVAAVHEGTMSMATFHTLLAQFLKNLGNPLEFEELATVAKCMLSGHAEPDPEVV